MRGKDFHRSGFQTSDRITPAWAGKMRTGRQCRGLGWDHPRVGGEKRPAFSMMDSVSGSPPRGRGKVDIDLFGFLCRGITPAWAGKSAVSVTPCHLPEDHPRVGGEKPAVAAHVRAQLGSPPRGRGKAQRLLSHSDPLGITPAWAGKSEKRHAYPSGLRDHPRVGGEKCCSPCPCGGPQRITPAWAGKRL